MKIKNIHPKPILIGYKNNFPITIKTGEIGEIDWSKEEVESMLKRKVIEVLEEKPNKKKRGEIIGSK